MISQIGAYFKEKDRFFIALTSLGAWGLVAFGQPAWWPFLGPLTSLFGFALFWWGLLKILSKKARFYFSTLWFMAVEAIHLSWMSSSEYQGTYIYLVYLFFVTALGAQFGLLSLFVCSKNNLSIQKIFSLSGLWVFMEWLRLFFLSGFPFNPVGLALSSTLYGIQWTAIGGVYFLSFWVIGTNLLFLKVLLLPKQIKNWIFFSMIALMPYMYGIFQVARHSSAIEGHPQKIRALLVQTALSPEEKTGMRGFDKMMPPLDQWILIFNYLSPYQNHPVDLILLPECSVPFGSKTPLYPRELLEQAVGYFLGPKGLRHFHTLAGEKELLDNLFISQLLSEIFEAQLLIGLEHRVDANKDPFIYASAFSLRPGEVFEVYYKRILLPIVEYLPFKWCEELAKKYHISGWFQRGHLPQVFSGPNKISPSICIEELFCGLIRKNRLLGGEVFVNLTNDVWFPNSKLPEQHYHHARLRAVENGVSLLRACNTGVTAAIDALGREIATFSTHSKTSQWKRGALYVIVPKYQFKTPYYFLGNAFVLLLSLVGILIPVVNRISNYKVELSEKEIKGRIGEN